MACCAKRACFAGHPDCSAKTKYALKVTPDHPMGADQKRSVLSGFRTSKFSTMTMMVKRSFLADYEPDDPWICCNG
jgi:hypothetical protein